MPVPIGGVDVPAICPAYDSEAKVMIAYSKYEYLVHEQKGKLIPLPREG